MKYSKRVQPIATISSEDAVALLIAVQMQFSMQRGSAKNGAYREKMARISSVAAIIETMLKDRRTALSWNDFRTTCNNSGLELTVPTLEEYVYAVEFYTEINYFSNA